MIRIAIVGIRNYEARKRLSGKNIKDFQVLCIKAIDFEKVQKEKKEETHLVTHDQFINMVDVRLIQFA